MHLLSINDQVAERVPLNEEDARRCVAESVILAQRPAGRVAPERFGCLIAVPASEIGIDPAVRSHPDHLNSMVPELLIRRGTSHLPESSWNRC